MQYAVFSAFFIIEYKLYCHPCITRPLCMGRVRAVAYQVTRVVGGGVVMHHSKSKIARIMPTLVGFGMQDAYKCLG